MAQVTVEVEFDQEKGAVIFRMDLQGNNELEHELLAAAIGSGRKVVIIPDHKADEIFAGFAIQDEDIWPDALRALENRKRKAAGQPSLEEEEAAAANRDKMAKKAIADNAAAKEKEAEDAQAKQDADDTRLAKVVSSAVAAALDKK